MCHLWQWLKTTDNDSSQHMIICVGGVESLVQDIFCSFRCYHDCRHGHCSGAHDYVCICNLGWTNASCDVNCGCNNHSFCSKGVGHCDECQNRTMGLHCERCKPGSYGRPEDPEGGWEQGLVVFPEAKIIHIYIWINQLEWFWWWKKSSAANYNIIADYYITSVIPFLLVCINLFPLAKCCLTRLCAERFTDLSISLWLAKLQMVLLCDRLSALWLQWSWWPDQRRMPQHDRGVLLYTQYSRITLWHLSSWLLWQSQVRGQKNF